MGVYNPTGMLISTPLSLSLSHGFCDICCIVSVEQLEEAQVSGDIEYISVCESVGVYQAVCENASVFFPALAGRAAAEHTAWQQQQQMVRKVIFYSFQGLLSPSYIMFFHTSTVFTDTKRSNVLLGRVCFGSLPPLSPSPCLILYFTSSVSLIELSN